VGSETSGEDDKISDEGLFFCEGPGPRLIIGTELVDACELTEGKDGLGEIGCADRLDSIELIMLGDGAPPNLPFVLGRFDIGCAAVITTSRPGLRDSLRCR